MDVSPAEIINSSSADRPETGAYSKAEMQKIGHSLSVLSLNGNIATKAISRLLHRMDESEQRDQLRRKVIFRPDSLVQPLCDAVKICLQRDFDTLCKHDFPDEKRRPSAENSIAEVRSILGLAKD